MAEQRFPAAAHPLRGAGNCATSPPRPADERGFRGAGNGARGGHGPQTKAGLGARGTARATIHSAAGKGRAPKGRGELRERPPTHPQTKAGHLRGAHPQAKAGAT
ncbi:hypothetical protein GCM10010394_36310 [Streptomyces crystallinus]|uniref:Uncharacterized protein n=1 Tax=Streptomyces crystallinus TaxID=68191 RepID=A0ABP3R9W1_9ACTN